MAAIAVIHVLRLEVHIILFTALACNRGPHVMFLDLILFNAGKMNLTGVARKTAKANHSFHLSSSVVEPGGGVHYQIPGMRR